MENKRIYLFLKNLNKKNVSWKPVVHASPISSWFYRNSFIEVHRSHFFNHLVKERKKNGKSEKKKNRRKKKERERKIEK